MLPPEYLRIFLEDARFYAWAFEDAWPRAVAGAARTAKDRAGWHDALEGTRAAWERSYEGLAPTEAEGALASLFAGHAFAPDPLGGRRCAECDRWIPSDADPRARFCPGGHCRRQYNYALERRKDAVPEAVTLSETVS
jgi:hypothetical protein